MEHDGHYCVGYDLAVEKVHMQNNYDVT